MRGAPRRRVSSGSGVRARFVAFPQPGSWVTGHSREAFLRAAARAYASPEAEAELLP